MSSRRRNRGRVHCRVCGLSRITCRYDDEFDFALGAWPRHLSIRSRLLLLVLGVWLPAVVGFGLLANQAYRNEQELGRRGVEEMARGLNLLVERALDMRAAVGRTLAGSLALREGDLADFEREAGRVAQASESSVGLVDGRGHWLQAGGQLRPGLVLPGEEGRPGLVQSEVSAFLAAGSDDQAPVVAVYAPEPGLAEQRINVAVTFPVAVIQGVIEAQRPFEGGLIVGVLDRRQRVVARSVDPERWIGKRATGPLGDRATNDISGFGRSVSLDGVATSSYLSQDNRYGWQIVVAVPQANLARTAQKLTFQTILASAVLLLIGLAVAFHNAHRIGSAVHALQGAAGELGHDRVPPRHQTGVREADEVSVALHRAGVVIQESTRQLEARVHAAVQEAKDAQQRLLDSQKHEAIGRLTGGLAHDFNNLLQAINSALEILEHRSVDQTERGVVQAALRATTRATDLVRQMLAFGRSQPLRAEAIDPGELLRGSQLLTSKAVGERVQLRIEVDAGLPRVMVDPTQLELAVLNLVFNARDALGEAGGWIVVAMRRAVEADFSAHGPRGDFICLDVIDDGPGMDAEVRSRAFDPYYTTKSKNRGSGLGLAQVLTFARQSGGDAWIISEPGHGSRITMMLPVAGDAGPQGHGPAGAPAPSAVVTADGAAPLHVLMVEDDALVSGVVVPALEQAGHRVTHCETADDAQALMATSCQFDVLCTDIMMPGRLSGLDLVRWCRREWPSLPVVVASGYSAQQAPDDVIVLHKPYSIDVLSRALHEVIGRVDRDVLAQRTTA